MDHARAIAVACALAAGGCVTTATYEKKVSELEKQRADDARAADARAKALQARIDELEAKRADLEKQLADTGAKLGAERDALRKQLDDATALSGELKKRLEKLGQNVEKLTSEKGQLSQGLEDAKARLDELRRQKAAAEASAATFRGLVAKLRAMIDAGQLKVVIRDGRMLIALPNDVLFDSGKKAIKPDGQAALAKVAQALAAIPKRRFTVAGHTDDVPIHTPHFPSNWELSTARAVEVARLLITDGMKPEVLAAAGYGEFDPVAPNDTPEHRAQNRRIEIVLEPNLGELPALGDLASTAK